MGTVKDVEQIRYEDGWRALQERVVARAREVAAEYQESIGAHPPSASAQALYQFAREIEGWEP